MPKPLEKTCKNGKIRSNSKQTTKIQDGHCFYSKEAWELNTESLLIKFMQGPASWQLYLPLGHKGLKTRKSRHSLIFKGFHFAIPFRIARQDEG